MNRIKTKKGFTLVELLVVIAIMGILTVIAVSQFQTAKRKANDVARKSDINSVNKALQMYYADYGEFPPQTPGEDDPVSVDLNILMELGQEFKDNSLPAYTYMKVMPTEKNSAMPPYCYVVTADRKKFIVLTGLENEGDSDYNRLNGGNPYIFTVCGAANEYNFALMSPNAVIGDFTL